MHLFFFFSFCQKFFLLGVGKSVNYLIEEAKNIVNVIANEAADPRGSAVELANHRAVREYRRKISSQRKGPFFDHIWV